MSVRGGFFWSIVNACVFACLVAAWSERIPGWAWFFISLLFFCNAWDISARSGTAKKEKETP